MSWNVPLVSLTILLHVHLQYLFRMDKRDDRHTQEWRTFICFTFISSRAMSLINLIYSYH